jgi:hypothetical protein
MNAAREHLLRQTAQAATDVRALALANPVESEGDYPIQRVLTELNAAHRTLLDAIADYPHALAANPDTGASDEAAHLLANLVSALSSIVVRYHGQDTFLSSDRDTFPLALRDVLVQATLLLAKLGPLEGDVHQYARRIAPDVADAGWRAAALHAAALAEGAWSRAVRPELTVHRLGLSMLAVATFVIESEYNFGFGPKTMLRFRVEDLLRPVATDAMWAKGPMTAIDEVDKSLSAAERKRTIEQLYEERNARMATLVSQVETTLVVAGVDLHNPGPQHRELVARWRYLQEPAPSAEGSDLGINGYALPYTWRAHLAEGAVRALGYLSDNPLKAKVSPT